MHACFVNICYVTIDDIKLAQAILLQREALLSFEKFSQYQVLRNL